MSLVIIQPHARTMYADRRLSCGQSRDNDIFKLREIGDLVLGTVGGLRDFTVACQWAVDMERNDADAEQVAWELADYLSEHGTPSNDASSSHIVVADKVSGRAFFIEDSRAVVELVETTAIGHGSIAGYALLDAGHSVPEVFRVVSHRDNTVSEEFQIVEW